MMHTKGPWTAREITSEFRGDRHVAPYPVYYAIESGKIYIASVRDLADDKRRRATTAADARLIAAAPELLEACKAVTTLPVDPETGSMVVTGPVYRKIVEAIAKTEGRTL